MSAGSNIVTCVITEALKTILKNLQNIIKDSWGHLIVSGFCYQTLKPNTGLL